MARNRTAWKMFDIVRWVPEGSTASVDMVEMVPGVLQALSAVSRNSGGIFLAVYEPEQYSFYADVVVDFLTTSNSMMCFGLFSGRSRADHPNWQSLGSLQPRAELSGKSRRAALRLGFLRRECAEILRPSGGKSLFEHRSFLDLFWRRGRRTRDGCGRFQRAGRPHLHLRLVESGQPPETVHADPYGNGALGMRAENPGAVFGSVQAGPDTGHFFRKNV